MSLRIVEWSVRNKGIESYYTRLFEPSVVAIQEGLSPEVRRLRELEALGYENRPQEFMWAEKLCYTAGSLEDVDPDTVRALRPTIEHDEPEWVERIEKEWQVRTWIVESVAYRSGVPLPATLAIMLNLDDRRPAVEPPSFSTRNPHGPYTKRFGGHPGT